VTLEASAYGLTSTSVLQVQIFVNGARFAESSSTGFTLLAQTSGTIRH